MPAPTITPFLWFDGQAEEAVKHYASVFGDAPILDTKRAGPDGPVMSLTIEVQGQRLIAFNGGPMFKFNEAISLMVLCETQFEIDRYWERLCEGGSESRCGWLKDRFGVSWQIIPRQLGVLLGDPDPQRGQRVMQAMLKMNKIDIATLENARELG